MRKLALVTLLLAVPLFAADSYVLRLDSISYMNGKGMSIESLKQLKNAHGKRFLWFERSGHTYVVKDASELERAEAIVRPQSELGQKQGALGEKQSELGQKQAQLGMQQASLGLRQASMSGSVHAQEELSRRQEELAKKQEALGKQQEVLGHEQKKLGDAQDRLSAQVERQLADFADQCIRTGVAKEVR